ncbi:MAG: choice-of-anchor D domain-containing protein [Bacteroidota bacterium]|nr:choice-of-anchor D domain-containing protein [Bacteroidota bacterium]MDP4234956.1 choice-of-anchor D domain-containing protein [Bacteroidota bacterium]
MKHFWKPSAMGAIVALLIASVMLPSLSFGQLMFRPKLMNFDTTLCGTKKCMTLVVKDTGKTSVTIDTHEAFFTPFEPSASTPFVYPLTLNPGDSVSYDICYSPTSPGSFDTVRSVFSYDGTSKDTLTMIGRSTGSNISINNSSLDYGVIQLFNVSCKTVTVTNTGDGTLNFDTIRNLNPPYTVQTQPLSLSPGSSTDITICFTPAFGGPQPATIWIAYYKCGTIDSIPIQLTGQGALPPKVSLGPVLQILKAPTDFDTTLCGTTKCTTASFTNTGNAPLTITQFGSITFPFTLSASTQVTLPLTLQPNQVKTLDLCYSPSVSPALDSVVIPYVADNRVSLSIAMLFDVSGSMSIQTGTPGVTRILAANSGGKVFIDNLINDPSRGIIDEAAVVKFSSTITVAQTFTTDTALLKNAVPKTVGGGTKLYDALDTTVLLVKTRNQPGRRVIVLLSDGDDNTGYVPFRINNIINSAAGDVRIYTIGIGNNLSANGIKTLTDIANGTGGKNYLTNNPDTLVQIYRQIAISLSSNIPGNFVIKGRSVAPILEIAPTTITFDSVKVGNSRCSSLTLRNTGDAVLRMDTLPASINGFSLQATTPLIIPPGGSANVTACFQPTRLRILDTGFTFTVNECHPSIRLGVQGIGYDSVIIALEDTIVAKPGSEVLIPIHLRSKIPAEYDVKSLEITLGHNKTMLYPETPAASTTSTATAPFLTESVANVFDASTSGSTNSYVLSGNAIASLSSDTVLVRLRFMALLGNAVSTPLSIVSAKFADGNPKVGIVSSGIFSIDSLCYLNKRLIDASARIRGAFDIHIGQDPSTVYLGFTLPVADLTSITIFNQIGQIVYSPDPSLMPAGQNRAVIDSRSLGSGLYFIKVQSGGQMDNVSFFIRK